MNATLRENIDWVGHVDWNVRDFHGYETRRGATYNAYLIRDEKTALIDTVKASFVGEFLDNIKALTSLDKVDYIIINHAEPDHSGGLAAVMKSIPNATVVCDQKCRDALSKYHDASNWKFHIVKTGDTLSLGRKTLEFIETPMVHWPESMFTYLREDKILFSMDAFGQHYATSGRFDDENPIDIAMQEAKIYYASILMLYGTQIAKTLEKCSGLDIQMIAPSHGVIWRSHIDKIITAYKDWSAYKVKPKVLVIYDSMWKSTEEMANAIYHGANVDGVDVRLIHIRATTLSEIANEVLDCAAIAFGSPALNMGMMPMAGAVLVYLRGLRPLGKAGFAFGSYGWSKGGPEEIDEWLKTMKFDVLREPLKSQYSPTQEILDECRAAGKMLAEKALQSANK